MSKAASRGSSKVELVATTTMATTGDDSSPGPLTRSARKNAAAGATAGAAAPKPSTSSSRFGAEAAAGGSRGSKATAATAKKESSSMQASRGAAAQKRPLAPILPLQSTPCCSRPTARRRTSGSSSRCWSRSSKRSELDDEQEGKKEQGTTIESRDRESETFFLKISLKKTTSLSTPTDLPPFPPPKKTHTR